MLRELFLDLNLLRWQLELTSSECDLLLLCRSWFVCIDEISLDLPLLLFKISHHILTCTSCFNQHVNVSFVGLSIRVSTKRLQDMLCIWEIDIRNHLSEDVLQGLCVLCLLVLLFLCGPTSLFTTLFTRLCGSFFLRLMLNLLLCIFDSFSVWYNRGSCLCNGCRVHTSNKFLDCFRVYSH